MPQLNPKNLAIGLLTAAVLGLGAVVAIDHTAGAAPAAPVVAAPASAATSTTATELGSLGQVAWGARGAGIGGVLKMFTQDTGLTAQQILAGIRAGKTLDELAGPSATKLHDDLVAAITKELGTAVTKGAISSSQESTLAGDISSAVTVVMAAKLGALIPAGH